VEIHTSQPLERVHPLVDVSQPLQAFAAAAGHALSELSRRTAAAVRTWQAARSAQRDKVLLRSLPDHILRDIGVPPCVVSDAFIPERSSWRDWP
jgi:uncharacterized protein YjiS (DUF1127 family)